MKCAAALDDLLWVTLSGSAKVLLLTAHLCPLLAQTKLRPSEAILRFFPPQVVETADLRSLEYDLVALELDLDGTGREDYLVAVFANWRQAAIVLLRRTADGWTKVPVPELPDFWGTWPSLETIDVDGDRRPEVLLSLPCSMRHQTCDWVFKWDRASFQSIGPSRASEGGAIYNPLVENSFVDIDGDGLLEAVTTPLFGGLGTLEWAQTHESTDGIYRLLQGRYSHSAAEAVFVGGFGSRALSGPTAEFLVDQPTPGYRLSIVSGIAGGKPIPPVSVYVNGRRVIRPSQIGAGRRSLSIPLTVSKHNTVTVQFKGGSGDSITVFVLKP